MTYLRLTVIGARRKGELALPEDHPVEELLPEIIALLDEPVTASPLVLTTLAGVPVDANLTFAGQGLDNGMILRLCPVDAAPQPPEVAEVTESVADEAVSRKDRWNSKMTAISLGGVMALTVIASTTTMPFPPRASVLALAVVFTLGAAGGAMCYRHGNNISTSGLVALSVGVALPLTHGIANSWLPLDAPAMAAMTWALAWIAVGAVFGIGGGRRSVLLGTFVAVLTGAVAVLTTVTTAPLLTIAAFAGISAAALLGLAPALALAIAGVTRFDDAVIDGEPVDHRDLTAAIGEAFAAQTALVLALTVPLAGSILALLTGDGWGQGLAAALAGFVLVRARLFPLAVSRMALLLTGVLPIAFWLWAGNTPVGLRFGVGTLTCVVLLLACVLPFSAAARARLRRLLGVGEALCVIAMVPLLLGVLGMFRDLLGAFS